MAISQGIRESETDRLQKIIDRASRFSRLFNDELFLEFMGLIKSKQSRYDDMSKNPPRVGSFRTYPQESTITTELSKGEVMHQKTITKIPFKITLEENIEHIKEYSIRSSEVQLVVDLPKTIELDAKRAKADLERIKPVEKKGSTK